jgi:glycosyltransferase involved in cell wall biosynthesis
MSARGASVLHLGPLHSVHLARWVELSRGLGLRVLVGGHLREHSDSAVSPHSVDELHRSPAAPSDDAGCQSLAWLDALLQRAQPDLVHGHWLPGWAATAVRTGAPVVVSAWGSDVYMASGHQRRRADAALRGAGRVLAPSPHMLRELAARGVAGDRLALVDIGVDLESFRPADPASAAQAKARLGLAPGPVVFSFRAAKPLYNLPVVVEAFGLLRETFPEAQLVVAHGSAPPAPEVARALDQAAPRPEVLVVGDVAPTDMPLYFRVADAGVSIPGSDGSPRSVWECLASGRPVVLSDLPQIRERVDGHPAVRLVEPQSTAVADALIELLTDESGAAERSIAARRWAARHMDHRLHQRSLGRVYEDVLGSR